MEFNLEIRKKQLQSLQQYIRSSEDNVKAIFQSLGWTVQKTLQEEDPNIPCPVDKNHLIARKTYKEHVEKCTLKSTGYHENEAFLSEPPAIGEASIKLTSAKKLEIFSAVKVNKFDFRMVQAWNGRDGDPLTSDRLTSTFSVDERLALYDYSTKHTKGPTKPDEFTLDLLDSKDKKELTEKEMLSFERDVKRRRAKYKSVHTSKKSQTEIMRELIDNQMVLYTDWIKQKQEKERREKERLKRRAKDKKKSSSNQPTDDQYQFIGTTYDQPSQAYTNVYGSDQYYNAIQANQGVITDWSHLYQGGIDTADLYAGSGQADEGTYTDPNTLESAAQAPYSHSEQLPTGNGELGEHKYAENRLKDDSRRGKLKKP